ncbi:hypothetical protein NONI108955_22625 [Nocardia ninae]|uniref:Uncharacterized protein n=1 Tax=Nocardia ninae NBRC 108245 TaxID=1210091 RepID=A0A511MCZ8_9NOCA|nr:hypothetical protein [Nocardia ninae]GEM38530.1 hypothetical protein NN4_30490 [Nocardia ninae NBRC 108245]
MNSLQKREQSTVTFHPLEYVRDQYADALQLLAAHGYDACITDTGGGCLAIEVGPIANSQLLITDPEGPLCDMRKDQTGWAIGFYGEDNGLILYVITDKKTAKSLLELLAAAIRTAQLAVD